MRERDQSACKLPILSTQTLHRNLFYLPEREDHCTYWLQEFDESAICDGVIFLLFFLPKHYIAQSF